MEDKNKEKEEGKEVPIINESDNENLEVIDGDTLSEIDEKNDKDKKIKNLMSAVIVLLGIAAGSLFVDVVQLVNGTGYSKKALQDSEIFVAGDKTWVAYEDPAVQMSILTVSEEEAENCPNCDPGEVVTWLKRFIPTLVPKRVEMNSPEGEKMIEKYDLKTVPSFVFADEIENSQFYQQEAQMLFEEKDDSFILNATGLGIPIGKYLEKPEFSENDSVLGDPDAKVKVIVFSDFQCPFCGKFFSQIVKTVKSFGNDVALVYKDLPLDFHPQGRNSALAVRCAGEQGKFWEMADLLYSTQDIWGKQEGKNTFKTMAQRIGVGGTKFNQCLEDEKFADQIEEDMALAQSFGVSGTPATFIDDQFISGVIEEVELKKIIETTLIEKE